MKKIFFILNYRSGTNLWLFLNGKKEVPFAASLKTRAIVGGSSLINSGTPDIVRHPNGWKGSQNSFFFPTLPKYICPCDNAFGGPTFIQSVIDSSPPYDYFAFHTEHGDWWGEATSNTVPGPYDLETPMRYGPDELKNWPGDNWMFFYLVRDGRDQIESLRNIPGGIEKEKDLANHQDYFEVLCKGYRNRCRLALDCQSLLPNFTILKFEDFSSDPLAFMSKIYNKIGLTPDLEYMSKAHSLTISSESDKRHSSFLGTKELKQRRWDNWSNWDRETFSRIAGLELGELGYQW